jgi:CheY-like chemotaxis protein
MILIDLMMPVMDGFEFRKEQLRNPALASITTVLLTAARNGREQAEVLGVQEYLQKPLRLDVLLELVSRGTKRRGLPEPVADTTGGCSTADRQVGREGDPGVAGSVAEAIARLWQRELGEPDTLSAITDGNQIF